MDDFKKFVATLFDFSFTEFVTPQIVKILYGIGLFVVALATLTFIGSGFSASFGRGILVLIISPVVFLIYTIFARVSIEVIIVAFRVYAKLNNEEHSAETETKGEK